MGAASSSTVEPRHARIWANLSSLDSVEARLTTLDTLFSGAEFVAAAKKAGLYAPLLTWIAATRRGEYAAWPGSSTPRNPPPSYGGGGTRASEGGPPLSIHDKPARNTVHNTLSVVPPPKRALDVLHESYAVLSLDDSKPLTHEALKQAYKRAALAAHPDKGGSPAQFDAVTRAFTYIEEVLLKLLPKTATDGSDPRFTVAVTLDNAKKSRGPATPGVAEIEDRAPVALNPKKLNMTVFNQLFEENKLPDPDKDDGYGDWLTTQTPDAPKTHEGLRAKFNADVFHKTFADETRARLGESSKATTMSKYQTPAEMVLAPGFGTELGGGRPALYTRAPGSAGIGYTDLKFAYGDGSTFSHEVADVNLEGRPKNVEEAKREYATAPRALSPEEAAAVAAFDRAKQAAEEARQRRVAAKDVDAESAHQKLQRRLMLQ
jgi:hypothetical protein